MSTQRDKNIWLDGIMGVVVGDALGVPVEFLERELLQKDPLKGMRGYGTYNLPKGSWSDDSSMTLATLDSLKSGYNLEDIMSRFVAFMTKGEYTPFGTAFDIGNGTCDSIIRYMKDRNVKTCGGTAEYNNGNGSLMRIMPICLYLFEHKEAVSTPEEERIQILHEVSGLTHNHIRSKMACSLYYYMVEAILTQSGTLKEKLQAGLNKGFTYYEQDLRNMVELSYYGRLRNLEDFILVENKDIRSFGYVVDTIEAAVWCLITTKSYAECVLKAVNLGYDTDTVAAIAGGLAGLQYGYDEIPKEWLEVIQRREWIETLCL